MKINCCDCKRCCEAPSMDDSLDGDMLEDSRQDSVVGVRARWLCVGAASLACVVACASLVGVLALLGSERAATTPTGTTPFTLAHLFNSSSRIRPRTPEAKWSRDGEWLYCANASSLSRRNRYVHEIVWAWHTAPFNISEWQVSPSGRFILVSSEHEPIWRYSYRATYRAYDTRSASFADLRLTNVDGIAFPRNDDTLFYVCSNNVYRVRLSDESLEHFQLSHDGTPGKLWPTVF